MLSCYFFNFILGISYPWNIFALLFSIFNRDDWGAIILVDDRFLHGEKYVKGEKLANILFEFSAFLFISIIKKKIIQSYLSFHLGN